jgi:hypothetical protein
MTRLCRISIASCLAAFLPFVFLVLATGAATPQQHTTTATPEQLRAEHQRVLDQLNVKDAKGKPLELDDPKVPQLLKKGWGLAGQWAAAYFDAHPSPSTQNLQHIFEGFAPEPQGVKSPYGNFLEYHDYYFTGCAVRIAPSVYVLEASYGVEFRTGTFMVVARNADGHFQTLWNIKGLAEKHYPQRDEIGRWMYLVRRAYYSGPLDVNELLALPFSTNGHPRFLVDAYQGADGGTILGQLSIWEWDGAEAKPLLVKLYEYAAGSNDSRRFRFDGRTIRISTKEELHAFSSCGMCEAPRGVWTVGITPTGVRDLGHRFLQPEFQWADDLLSTIEKGKDATNLADAKVVKTLKDHIREVQAEAADRAQDASEKTEFWWGMLDRCVVIHRGQRGAFLLVVDEGRLRFGYVLRNGKPYFTHVRIE